MIKNIISIFITSDLTEGLKIQKRRSQKRKLNLTLNYLEIRKAGASLMGLP